MLEELANFTSEHSDTLLGELHCLIREITALKAAKGLIFAVCTFMLCVMSCATFQSTAKIVEFKETASSLFKVDTIAKATKNCTAPIKVFWISYCTTP